MRLKVLLRKELLQLRRDPALFRMAVFMPIIQTILLSYAANMDVVRVPISVWDADHSSASRLMVQAIGASESFAPPLWRDSPAELQDDLDSGKAALALILPSGFERDLERGTAKAQLLVDGTESTTNAVAASYLGQIAARYGAGIQQDRLAARGLRIPIGRFQSVSRVLYNPDMKTLWFMAPAIMGLVLTTLMQNLTALSIAREREMGTLEQLVMTPVTPAEILLGKLIPFGVIGLFDAAFVTGIVVFILHVPLRGSALLLAGSAVIFLFAVLGLGLLVSTVSANQQQAQLTNFFLSFPSILLSGFIFPVWNMPPVLQTVGLFVPMTHFLAITRGVFLRGSGIEALWGHLVWLAALALAFFVLGARRFHKRLD